MAVWCLTPLWPVLQVVMKQNAVIEHLKQKKTLSPAEREENQRYEHRRAGFRFRESGRFPRP